MFGRTEKQVWHVDGMTCGHCEQRVEKTVSQLNGVKKVKASHADHTVEIAFKKGEPPDAGLIEEAITELGFEVK